MKENILKFLIGVVVLVCIILSPLIVPIVILWSIGDDIMDYNQDDLARKKE